MATHTMRGERFCGAEDATAPKLCLTSPAVTSPNAAAGWASSTRRAPAFIPMRSRATGDGLSNGSPRASRRTSGLCASARLKPPAASTPSGTPTCPPTAPFLASSAPRLRTGPDTPPLPGRAAFEKITPLPVAETRFLDPDLLHSAEHSYCVTAADAHSEGPPSDAVTAAASDRTTNLLLNPGAEEQSTRGWVNASSISVPDPANRHCFHNDLFVGVTNAHSAQGQWAFWADQTKGRYDRETYTIVDETYFLAAHQDVDVSDFSSIIDSPDRKIFADWSGKVIRTSSDQFTAPSIAIEFLDTHQTALARHELSTETIGEWVEISSSDPVPAGTIALRFWMFAPDVKPTPVNAAWDNLSVVLREEPPSQPLEVTLFAQPAGVLVLLSPTSPSATYQIEYTDNLPSEPAQWKPCGPPLVGNGQTLEWLDSPDELTNPTNPPAHSVTQRFYRVRQP
jgi:hypothetical protein